MRYEESWWVMGARVAGGEWGVAAAVAKDSAPLAAWEDLMVAVVAGTVSKDVMGPDTE